MAVFHKVHVLLVLVCLVTVNCMSLEHYQAFKRSAHWCGKRLSDAMQLICDGKYQPLFKNKKSSQNDFETPELTENLLLEDFPLFPFMFPRLPVEMQQEGMRVRRGITEECCYKECSLAILKTYCAE